MTDYRATYPGFPAGYDDFQSAAVTSLTSGSSTGVTGFARMAGLADPGYFTYVTGVFTMVRAGLYSINFSATFATSTVGSRVVLLFVNGVEVRRVNVGSGGTATPQVTNISRLAVGDTVEPKVIQTSGGALALGSAPGHDFQMMCVGV